MNLSKIRAGVYVCRCGTNIAATVDVEAVAAYAARLDGVTLAREYSYMCSDPGQDLIKQDILEYGLNRVVVASCSPLMHEPTFRAACSPGRAEPVFLPDGEHPRAVLVGDRRPGGSDGKSDKHLVAAAVRRVYLTSRWTTAKSR